jgi:hypothetical protein
MASEEGKQHSSRLAANGKYSNQCTAAEIVKCGTEQRKMTEFKGFFPHNTELESSLEVSLPASFRRALRVTVPCENQTAFSLRKGAGLWLSNPHF